MKAWSELVAAGLVGTGRAELPSLAGDSPGLDALLRGLEGRTAERRLLAAAATVAVWQRAGALAPVTPQALPPEAPVAKNGESCEPSPASAEHLAQVLGDPALTPLLPEWLVALQRDGHCLPYRWLPEMLDTAGQNAALRPLILAVLGSRGAWLAAQNPDWARLQVPQQREAILERWATAPFADRLDLLRQVRQADPALGRELVASTWQHEAPRERAAFLLSINLSMDGEPFAEAALDDRRREVRAAAAGVAASLPGSRLCRRMLERVRPLIQYRPGEKPGLRNLGMGKRAGMQVTLPEACDSGMQRDGVELKPPQAGLLGERAWWLAQMLGAVPPQTWTGAWHATPAELVAAAEGEWGELLWQGWQAAALRFRDAGWAEALIEAALEGTQTLEVTIGVQAARTLVERLWPVLPGERQEALIELMFRTENQALHDQHPAAWLLSLTDHTWSESLGRTVLSGLQARIRQGDSAPGRDWQLRSQLKQYARCMPPGLAAEAAGGWQRDAPAWGFWGSAVDEFLNVLQYRHDMLAALAAG